MKRWNVKSSKIVLENPWLRVRENSYILPNGNKIPKYYIAERADSAICVCVRGSDVLLVRQYRPGIEKTTLCHPGGRIETSDSSAVAGGLRELLEETGYTPQIWETLGIYGQIPAVSSAKVHILLVEYVGDKKSTLTQDPNEDIEMEVVPISALRDIIAQGDMDCVACVAASYLALSRLRR